MYKFEEVRARHRLADTPVSMPVNYLHALPPYVTEDGARFPLFHLPATIRRVLGSAGWERTLRVIDPYYWAPGWTQERLMTFARLPFRTGLAYGPPPPYVTVKDAFPGTGSLADPASHEYRPFDIVHFAGSVLSGSDGEPRLALSGQDFLPAESLHTALDAAATRLLILQPLPGGDIDPVVDLGRRVVERGGPAVLVADGDDAYALAEFFTRLLADLVHNESLAGTAAQPWAPEHVDALVLYLLAGEGWRELFNFVPYHQTVRERLDEVREVLDRAEQDANRDRRGAQRYLHSSQHSAFAEDLTGELGELNEMLEEAQQNLHISSWDSESTSSLPLTSAEAALEQVTARLDDFVGRYSAVVERELETAASHAPRVLNATFGDPRSGAILRPSQALATGEEYDLLVDVGPRWNTIPSLVSGQAQFPENALPADVDGYAIQVVLVSDDFTPPIASADIWVPRRTGRSFPVYGGRPADRPGPVALRLRAPEFPRDNPEPLLIAHARLCLYYENNLIQSAAVTAGVARSAGVGLERPNAIEVDYVLSGGFQELEEAFAVRQVRVGESESLPVALNLTMNDSGNGRHRFVVKGRFDGGIVSHGAVPNGDACSPHAWIPYDSKAGEKLLKDARQNVLDCFYQKDSSGAYLLKGNKPIPGLNPATNGKDREQFKIDLRILAEFGRRLWSSAFNQPVVEDPDRCNATQWQQNLLSLLAHSSVIQVSRTGPAQYVFPWTMIYEYPLNRSEWDDWEWCKIIEEEWDADGVRHPPEKERTTCEYHDEPWHGKNVICPYGLWGLKHVLEEPISLHPAKDKRRLDNVCNEVRIEGPLTLAVGLTADTSLDRARIKDHLKSLAGQGAQLVPVEPAADWKGVRSMLRAPEVVYFLCHGEHDEEMDEDYLSIGPRGDDLKHRIYVRGTLNEWQVDRSVDGPDVKAWTQRGPLVFINGCHTADLHPGQIVSFSTVFSNVGANGVLGTQISVDLPVAIEVAESLFRKIGPPDYQPLGQALHQVRWELTNKGNLLGLAYTLYGLADLHLVRDEG